MALRKGKKRQKAENNMYRPGKRKQNRKSNEFN